MPRTLRHALLLLATGVAPVMAQDSTAVPVTKITADFGYVSTTGNTRVSTMNVGEKLSHERGRITIQQGFALVYGKQRDTVSTNSLRANVRADYTIDQFFALFLGAAFDRNTFAGIERRFEEQLGVGARLIAAPFDTVRAEGGASITQQLGTDNVQRNFPSARLAIVWRHNFTPGSYFQQNAELIPNLRDGEDWRLNTDTSIIAPISARIGMKLSYVIRYDHLPEPGFKDTDELFTTGIQITFE